MVFFVILVRAGQAAGRLSPLWLVAAYFLQTTRREPPYGHLFLAGAVGNYISRFLARFYDTFALSALCSLVGDITIALGALMYLLLPSVKRPMGDAD